MLVFATVAVTSLCVGPAFASFDGFLGNWEGLGLTPDRGNVKVSLVVTKVDGSKALGTYGYQGPNGWAEQQFDGTIKEVAGVPTLSYSLAVKGAGGGTITAAYEFRLVDASTIEGQATGSVSVSIRLKKK